MAYNVSLEDSSPLISYKPVGSWNDMPQDDSAIAYYSGSSFHKTATQGASLSFSFNGTDIWLYGARKPDYGTYSISIDGHPVIEDDASSSTPTFQQLLGAVIGLEMGLHQVELTNTGSLLDLDYMVFQTPTSEGATMSTITFNNTNSSISHDPQWTTGDNTGSHKNNIHYMWDPDAFFRFAFDGDAVAIYGTVAPLMGNYIVNLDGVEHQLKGTARVTHPHTLLYFANTIGDQSHNLVITAHPSELGDSSSLKLDAISVFSTPSGAGDPASSALLLSSTSSFSNPTTSVSVLTPASKTSTFLTNEGVIAGIISACVICLFAIISFLLFCWKRHYCDPPSYKDMEETEDNTGFPPTPITPGLPIQDVEKHAGLYDGQDHVPAYRSLHVPYHRSASSRLTFHEVYKSSRFPKSQSSVSKSDYGVESNRSTVFSLAPYILNSHRSGMDMGLRPPYSSTSDESLRILIHGIPMPPQIKIPRIPLPSVPPPRPSRQRDTIPIPF